MNIQRLRDILHKALQSGLPPLSPDQTLFSDVLWLKRIPENIRHDLTDYIEAEEELRIFDQGGMNFGNSMTLVTHDDLLRWLFRRTADRGVDTTIDNLVRYLRVEEVPGFDVLAVEGVEVDAPLTLAGGICLIPFVSLPASITKEMLTRPPLNRSLGLPGPMAALTANVSGGRKMRSETFTGMPTLYDNGRANELEEACLSLTVMQGAAPTPLAHWWEPEEWIPCTPQSGGGFRGHIYDIINRSHFTINTEELRAKAQSIHRSFARLSAAMKIKLKVPLERLNHARRRISRVDRAIDLGVALESLFLQDDPPSAQLSLTFRLRAAWFLSGENPDLRKEHFRLFKWLYQCRSRAVHHGTLDERVRGIPMAIDELLANGEDLAAEAIEKLINLGRFPDWDDLVLGRE